MNSFRKALPDLIAQNRWAIARIAEQGNKMSESANSVLVLMARLDEAETHIAEARVRQAKLINELDAARSRIAELEEGLERQSPHVNSFRKDHGAPDNEDDGLCATCGGSGQAPESEGWPNGRSCPDCAIMALNLENSHYWNR